MADTGYRWYIDQTIADELRSVKTYRLLIPVPFIGALALLFFLPRYGTPFGNELISALTYLGASLMLATTAFPIKEYLKTKTNVRNWRVVSTRYYADCECDPGNLQECEKIRKWLAETTKP